jgi:hypothetical protein
MEVNQSTVGATDLTGLGKLADSKVVNKLYDDGASSGMKEIGATFGDLAKAGRYVVNRLLSLGVNRFHEWMDEVEADVLPENRVEANPAIAGPAIQALSYMEPGDPLVKLYLNLLRRAIDRTRVDEAHPAFAKLIDQLSTDEALILWELHNKGHRVANVHTQHGKVLDRTESHITLDRLQNPQHIYIHLAHLKALHLTQTFHYLDYGEQVKELPGNPIRKSLNSSIGPYSVLTLTAFGQLFCKACVPDDFTFPGQYSSPDLGSALAQIRAPSEYFESPALRME